MSDLISRQAAIEAMATWDWQELYLPINFKQLLDDLPSAQPEQKTGEWIEKEICETRRKEEMQTAKCSNCKKWLTTPYIYSFNHYNYCPRCGTKMGG